MVISLGISLLLLIVPFATSRAPVMFKASRCYDGQGAVNVQLNCPHEYKIRVHTAYTGISRFNACSYLAWDCVIQEGGLQQCNGKSQCAVNVKSSLNQGGILSCGSEGKTTYFQIEFDCIAVDGSTAVVDEMPSELTAQLPALENNYLVVQDDAVVTLNRNASTAHDGISSTHAREPWSLPELAEDQVTLVAIVCGTSLALLLVIAVVAFVAYHRIKSRSYDQARLYGPLGSSVSSVVSPTLSHRDADVPLHMRTGPRRTPLPISAFDERAPQMERGRPRLGQNYDLRRFNEHV